MSGWWMAWPKRSERSNPPALPYVAEKASGGSVTFVAWGWRGDQSADVVGIDADGAAGARNAEGLAEPA